MKAIMAFVAKHSLITATTLFAITVGIVAMVVFSVGDKEASTVGDKVNDVSESDSLVSEDTQDDIQDLTLQCDAYPEINEVMEIYHKALAENDEETVNMWKVMKIFTVIHRKDFKKVRIMCMCHTS